MVVRPLSSSARRDSLVHAATDSIARRVEELGPKSVHLTATPWFNDVRAFVWAGYDIDVGYTSLLSLEPGVSAIERGLTRGARANLKKARGFPGLRIIRDKSSKMDTDQLWLIGKSTHDRAGIKVPDLRLFLRTLRSKMSPKNLWIVRAEIHDSSVAVGIFLRFGGKICGWIAMSDEKGLRSGAPTAIVWKAIEDASARGDTVLDLMGGQVRSLSTFNSGFQARPSPYFILNRWNSRWAKAGGRLAETIHRRLV